MEAISATVRNTDSRYDDRFKADFKKIKTSRGSVIRFTFSSGNSWRILFHVSRRSASSAASRCRRACSTSSACLLSNSSCNSRAACSSASSSNRVCSTLSACSASSAARPACRACILASSSGGSVVGNSAAARRSASASSSISACVSAGAITKRVNGARQTGHLFMPAGINSSHSR